MFPLKHQHNSVYASRGCVLTLLLMIMFAHESHSSPESTSGQPLDKTPLWPSSSNQSATSDQTVNKCNLFVEIARPSGLRGCQFYSKTSQEAACKPLWSRVKAPKLGHERPRVLVTGGAGFVGSHLVDSLMLDGNRVVVCDNFMTGRMANIAHWLGHSNFELINADVVDQAALNDLEVDEIYHLASPASPIHYMLDPIATIRTNTIGTNNMLDLAVKNRAKILIASTSEIYGDPTQHPQSESYWGNVNPVGPRSCYDESKRLSECITTAYIDTRNVSARIARIFNTYGPRMHVEDGRVVSNFIIQSIKDKPLTVYGDGEQTRSFQYITDLVSGLRSLMGSGVTSPVNLGNPEEVSINTLAAKIKNLVETSKSEIVFERLPIDDPQRRRPDISKANSLLDWQPQVSLLDGLVRTIEYFSQELNLNKQCS